MKISVLRLEQSEDQPTRGVLLIHDILFCVTLELPWRDNQRNISCIPDGVYDAVKYVSPTYGLTIKIINVPGRSDILLHYGNYKRNTQGCILIARSYGDSTEQDEGMICNSKVVYRQFQEIIRKLPEGEKIKAHIETVVKES